MTVELGNLSLEQLTHVAVREQTRIVQHPVPGMNGNLTQTLGRPSVTVVLQGIFYGENAATELEQLRSVHLAQQPVDFFTESVGEGFFTQVLISQLEVSQRVGYPHQFDFVCEVVEYVEPPEPITVNPFASIDTELVGEATAFVDDVQNSLEQVSQLTNLVANVPNFGDPTDELRSFLESFNTTTENQVGILGDIQTLLAGSEE
jgi:hypothetical protein